MATPINTSNIKLTELQTAPGGSTPSNFRFSISGREGWNLGILGTNTYTGLYTWGYGSGSAGYLDAIYGLNPPTSGTNPPLELGDWSGLQYYFDGSPFDLTYKWTNNLPNPVTPPFPPSANDVNIDVTVMDSSLTYSITNSTPAFSFLANCNSSQASSQWPGFIPDTYPLVKWVYWKIRATTDPVNWAGGQLDINVNGSPVLTGYGLSPGSNNVDWTGGTYGDTGSAGIELDFTIY